MAAWHILFLSYEDKFMTRNLKFMRV